jgi:hypothetical protein
MFKIQILETKTFDVAGAHPLEAHLPTAAQVLDFCYLDLLLISIF